MFITGKSNSLPTQNGSNVRLHHGGTSKTRWPMLVIAKAKMPKAFNTFLDTIQANKPIIIVDNSLSH
jgi:hypothetical protein